MLLRSIRRIHEAGHKVVLVCIPDELAGYGAGPDDFRLAAQELGATLLREVRLDTAGVLKQLREAEANIAISVNWPTVLGHEVIHCFGLGILNAHAGDLPRYRGNACANWAILQEEEKIVLTIHLMEPDGLDSGPVVLKRSRPISPTTIIGDLYQFFEEVIPEMFLEAAEGLFSGTIKPRPQPEDPALALRCYPRLPCDSLIDWNRDAAFLDRLVRASSEPFAGAYTYLGRNRLTIWRAWVAGFPCPALARPGQIVWRDSETGDVGVATGDGVLVLTQVQREGEQAVKASDILCSTRLRLGMVPEDSIAELRRRVDALERLLDERLR
jgi:methionyl-tRNA formyltransferase